MWRLESEVSPVCRTLVREHSDRVGFPIPCDDPKLGGYVLRDHTLAVQRVKFREVFKPQSKQEPNIRSAFGRAQDTHIVEGFARIFRMPLHDCLPFCRFSKDSGAK